MKTKSPSQSRERLRLRKQKSRERLRQIDLAAEPDGVFALDLQALYQASGLRDTWISFKEFTSRYSPTVQECLVGAQFVGAERSTAMIGGVLVELIRPKFLPKEENQ